MTSRCLGNGRSDASIVSRQKHNMLSLLHAACLKLLVFFYIYVYIYLYECMKNLCNMDMMVFALKLFTVFRVTVPSCNLMDGYQHSCTTYCPLSWQKIKAVCSSEMSIRTYQITSKCVSPDNHSTGIRTGV